VTAIWLLVAAVLTGLVAIRFGLRARTGVPGGQVVYSDTAERLEQALVSYRHRLAGKPDHVIRTRDGLVPVERKSRTWQGKQPLAGDRAQVLAYCLLLEETTGESVHHGIVRYADRQFTVPWGASQRAEIISLLAVMQADRRAPCVSRSHTRPARCRSCGVRASCGEALI
jgi:CRISPR-associated exonuclease Cas4